ncbi:MULTISPECIES: hypothetical protein [unclassified Photobacterium]|uniref:hypothetical protein n=1 Tax=unclassified Photobacterium TaxID=2628852 RepID=UPI001EDEE0C1|nr:MULTISPECIES: hypothetical protein [unclassified Photobacterium]MCG3864030.1 hypothetical protein [Photobacterium sp. Ph6]MCG3875560.1 hypothetical protein [Photobacterium sp. Ph5]
MLLNKKIFFLIIIIFSKCIFAQDISNKENFEGYSYFTVGSETVSYKEKFGDIESDVDVTSMIINTGGLYVINKMFDFSIDALATFSPQIGDEIWTRAGNNIQKNKFEYTRASTNVQLQYKYKPEIRFLLGPSFSYQVYKRYNVTALDELVNEINGVVEENTTDLFIDAGISYESNPVRNTQWRYSAKALIGYSVWNESRNTIFDGVKFSPSGYRYSLSANASYEIFTGVHTGLYAAYHYDKRNKDGGKRFIAKNGDKYDVTLPEADTTNITVGLQVIWNL